MARYMPFVIGALVAVCTACLFGCFSVGGVPGRSVPTSAGARQVSVAGMKEGLLAFSRRLGEMVPQQISGTTLPSLACCCAPMPPAALRGLSSRSLCGGSPQALWRFGAFWAYGHLGGSARKSGA